MTLGPVSATPPIGAPGVVPARHRTIFGNLLSELNPLQYIPVIGTIYRAVTGDIIPEAARTAGALVVSFLTGGPIGVALSVAATAVEKATGIDPERIGRTLLADLGIGHPTFPAAAPQAHPTPTPSAGWTPAELQSLGVTTAQGTLHLGALTGSDVLNSLELARASHQAAQAYAPRPPSAAVSTTA